MTTLTEQQLEDTLINQLVLNDYERAIIPNVDALLANFRKQMNRLNKENLSSTELSDKELIFLVDRRDLDTQTMEEFNRFDKGSVDETNKTDVLVDQLADPTKKRTCPVFRFYGNTATSRKQKSRRPYDFHNR